jgi:hypothetical protein
MKALIQSIFTPSESNAEFFRESPVHSKEFLVATLWGGISIASAIKILVSLRSQLVPYTSPMILGIPVIVSIIWVRAIRRHHSVRASLEKERINTIVSGSALDQALRTAAEMIFATLYCTSVVAWVLMLTLGMALAHPDWRKARTTFHPVTFHVSLSPLRQRTE